MKRTLRVLAYLVCGFALLLTIFHLEENWRGKRAWEAWKVERVVKGDRYDWSNLAPPEVPDADNFAKEPLVEAAITGHGSLLKDFKWPEPMPKFANWRLGQYEDLDAWAAGYKAKDLETALAPWKPQLDELVAASRRPACRLPIRYTFPEVSQDGIPALLGFRAATRVLRIRALARLRAGETDAAFEDTLANLRIAKHLQNEPLLILNLLQIAVSSIAMQPVWEGVADHRWNDAQLARLQAVLQDMDLLQSSKRAIQGERVFTALAYQEALGKGAWARAKGEAWSVVNDSVDAPPPFRRTLACLLFLPRGWVYQNMLSSDRFYVEVWLPVLDDAHHRVDAKAVELARLRIEKVKAGPCDWAGHIPFDILINQSERMAYRQNAVDEAVVACALERYHLAHHGYPETLAELVPTYLTKVPCDITTGAPLHYHRNADGSFDLYSVGWDGRDDGGKAVATKDGHADDSEGDWTWPRPASH